MGKFNSISATGKFHENLSTRLAFLKGIVEAESSFRLRLTLIFFL